MRSEMKSAKWFWGGIGLQLSVGYTVAYFVYTIGTLITAPEKLAIIPAVCGFIAILTISFIVALLIHNTHKKILLENKIN